ncbi:MAG: hypothetical protein JWR16_2128 [Nevskia sp.]|nr:hypothetical protein [Nevskia sp.]
MTARAARRVELPRLPALCAALALLTFGAVFAAHAGGSVEERRPLEADGRVYINNVAGTVVVNSWDKNEVYLRGELSGDADSVDVSGGPDNLSIIVKMPKKSHVSGDADLTLTVPTAARVELETVSADVSVQNLRGPLKVNTVSGAAQLQLASPDVSVQTVSGDVTLRGPSRLTFVKSVSGDMHLAGMQGKLVVETVSGNVQLDGGRFSDVHLKSVSGDMRLDVSLAQQAQIVGDTLSGDIILDVPSDVSGTALLKSFSGDASCDATLTNAAADSALSGRKGKREYTWGNGSGARVELSSFSGDIHVLRKAPHGSQTPPPFVGKD